MRLTLDVRFWPPQALVHMYTPYTIVHTQTPLQFCITSRIKSKFMILNVNVMSTLPVFLA